MNVLLQISKVNMEELHHYGSNDNIMDQRSKVTCCISQLIMYNMVKGTHSTHMSVDSVSIRHKRNKETPFPLMPTDNSSLCKLGLDIQCAIE